MKSLIVYLLVTLCFVLTACVSYPVSYYFNYDELKDKDKVVTVELINYVNQDVKKVKKRTDIFRFDFNKSDTV